jgi:hypothetical protein
MGVKFREAPTPLITYVLYNGAAIAAIVALIEKTSLGPLGTRWVVAVDLGYLVGEKADPTEPECPKSPIRHPAVMGLSGWHSHGGPCAFEPEAQGDNGATVATEPGCTSTLQPSSYATASIMTPRRLIDVAQQLM